MVMGKGTCRHDALLLLDFVSYSLWSVAFLLWFGISMAFNVISCLLVLDVKRIFCGVRYCYDACLEYVNYGTKSFTIYEGHLKMEKKN
jgi:hypothetical protein